MARLMFSDGMLFCLASAMIVRSRGFMSGSPPPARAATVNSLMRRVKILPRLASAAPFLCLMECHLEWPDMAKILPLSGQHDPDVRTRVPWTAAVVAEHVIDHEAGTVQAVGHLSYREGPERQREPVLGDSTFPSLDVPLMKHRPLTIRVLAHGLDEGEATPAWGAAAQLRAVGVFLP